MQEQSNSNPRRGQKRIPSVRSQQFNYQAFELAHILRIRPFPSEEETDTSNSYIPRITLSEFQEVNDNSLLALLCSNGSFVVIYYEKLKTPVVKQIDWFKNPTQRVKCFCIDPVRISWLACVCVDLSVYVVPLMTILGSARDSPRNSSSWSSKDLTLIATLKLSGLPVCATWWHTLDDRNVCIVGSDHGEIVFVDLWMQREILKVHLQERIERLHIFQDVNDCFSKLHITTADDAVWQIALEWSSGLLDFNSGSHSVSTDELGYDMICETNIEGILSYGKERLKDIRQTKIKDPGQDYQLCVQTHSDKKYITKFHRKLQLFKVYSDEEREPEFIYQLPPRALDVKLTDHVLFCLLPGQVHSETGLLILSKMYSCKPTSKHSVKTGMNDRAELQYFSLVTSEPVIGFHVKTFHRPSAWKGLFPHTQEYLEETPLTCCIIITNGGVIECRPRVSPEVYFTDLVAQHDISAAEALGITFGVNSPKLFELVADQKLKDKDVLAATKLYSFSKCSPVKRVSNLVKYATTADALVFIKQVLKNPDQIAAKDRKIISNMAVTCYVLQILQRQRSSAAAKTMAEDFRLFLRDNFDYDEQMALNVLAQNGLMANLFAVSKERGLIQEALELLAKRSLFVLSSQVQNMLLERGYSDLVCSSNEGAFLSAMDPADALKFLLMRPDVNTTLIKRILSLLPELSEASLMQVVRLFDPSRAFIKPYLRHAQKLHRERSLSIISVSSLDSLEDKDHTETPLLEDILEVFLKSVMVLQVRRESLHQIPDMRIVYKHTSVQTSWGSSRHHRQSSIRSADYVVSEPEKMTLACGRNHIAYVHENGDLYTWGRSHHGKLGHGDIIEEKGIANPFRVEGLHMLGLVVISVSCGTGHTVALCREGVYAWGHNRYGQLGVGDTRKRSRPVALADFTSKRVLTVTCGHYHTLAIQSDNEVWSWGWGIHGQLGLGSAENQLVPKHVELLKKRRIIQIAAGHSHSAVLTSKGLVYTFGSGFYGQLGIMTTMKRSKPQLMQSLSSETIYLIACGPFQTAAVSEDQTVYITGRNYRQYHICAKAESTYYGRQMANTMGDISHRQLAEGQLFQLQDTITQLAIGNWHYIALTSAGQVFTWGCNDCGQLGHFNKMDQPTPRLVKGLSRKCVMSVAAGAEFSVAVNVDDQVYVWGRADGRQLGLDESALKDFKPTTGKKKILCVLSPTLVPGLPIHSDQTSISSYQGSLKREILASDDVDFPDFSSIGSASHPYATESLLVALYRLDGSYNIHVVTRWCKMWSHQFAESACHQLQRLWHEAFSCRVKGILDYHSTKTDANKDTLETDMHIAVEALLSSIEDFLSEEEDFAEADSLSIISFLCNLLELWKDKTFNMATIEEMFTRRLEPLVGHFGVVFFGYFCEPSPSFQSNCKFLLSRIGPSREILKMFSSMFYCKLMTCLIDSRSYNRSSRRESKAGGVQEQIDQDTTSSELFLKEIVGHLAKQLQQRSAISLSDAKAATIAAASSAHRPENASGVNEGSQPDAVVFSCAHNFTYYYLVEIILPEFQARMERLPCPLPSTTAALLLQYRKIGVQIPCACPYCVYNGLRQEQLQLLQEAGELVSSYASTFWEV